MSLKFVRIACPPVDRLPDVALDAKEMFSYARTKLYLWPLIVSLLLYNYYCIIIGAMVAFLINKHANRNGLMHLIDMGQTLEGKGIKER